MISTKSMSLPFKMIPGTLTYIFQSGKFSKLISAVHYFKTAHGSTNAFFCFLVQYAACLCARSFNSGITKAVCMCIPLVIMLVSGLFFKSKTIAFNNVSFSANSFSFEVQSNCFTGFKQKKKNCSERNTIKPFPTMATILYIYSVVSFS